MHAPARAAVWSLNHWAAATDHWRGARAYWPFRLYTGGVAGNGNPTNELATIE